VAETAIAGARHSFSVPISVSLALAASAATFFSAPALAQTAANAAAPSADIGIPASSPAASGQAQLAEVVVTALKRSTNIQQTPVSMSAIGAQQLTDQGITDSSQLSRVAPNLIINQGSNGTDRLTIRDIYAAGEPTVGLYYDDTPVTGSVGVTSDAGGSTPDIQLFDVQRVEVLRGPQGTLYGAGSMAGTVRLIFNQPNLRQFGGTAAAQVDSVTGGDVGYDTQAEVNIPLVKDVVGARVVGFYQHQGGWLDNTILGLHHFNSSDNRGGRLLVRVKPAKNITVDGLAVFQNRQGYSSAWNYQTYVKGGPKYDQALETQTPVRDKLELYSGTLNWDFGFATLTAIGSYTRRDLAYNFDYSPYFTGAAASATPTSYGCLVYSGIPHGGACTPAQLSAYRTLAYSMAPVTAFQPQHTSESTEEVRLANDQGRFKWTVGFFHSSRNNFVDSELDLTNPLSGLAYSPVQMTYHRTVVDVLEQYAGFGEADYDLTRKLTLTLGLRYFDYRKTDTGAVQKANVVVGNTVQSPLTASSSQTGLVRKFGVSYKFTPNAMAYASASQGFRPGGVNESIGLPAGLAPYKSDSLWDYELGAKTEWLRHTLIVNGDLFQINWSNLQVSASANNGAFGFITNAGNVRVRGVELESTMLATERLTLQVSGSYTLARLLGNETAPAGITILGAGVNGDYVPMTPKVTAQGSADYVIPIGNSLQILNHVDVSYIGTSWTQFARLNAYEHELPGYALTGLRFGLENDEHRWGVYFFVDNLFNVTGLISKSSGASTGGITDVQAVTVMPRTIGLSFQMKFH
jgi:outer membrane receptor protein involved in Fe transport